MLHLFDDIDAKMKLHLNEPKELPVLKVGAGGTASGSIVSRILLIVLSQLLLCGPATAWSLRYLGQQIVPTGYVFADTTVGGLSGLDYDPLRRHYYAIPDDRSEHQTARFYTLALDLDAFNTRADPGHAGVTFTGVFMLRDRAGKPYARKQVDPESLRLAPGGDRLIWASEGAADSGIPPFVGEMSLQGDHLRIFSLPSRYQPGKGSGVRDNRAFESLAVVAETGRVYTAVENALIQDGPVADASQGSACRVLAYDLRTGQSVAEYAYVTDPVVQPPALPLMFHTNGLVELLALDAKSFIAVERSYTPMAGNNIRFYLASLAEATEVSALPSLAMGNFRPMTKTLLLDLSSLGISLDNIEGASWGPVLPNGHRSLVLVSDNNFNPAQFTQFLAFELIPKAGDQ
ncbi:MAG: esterase-like activity of phytase family protein [Pseudomonadota bacterium]